MSLAKYSDAEPSLHHYFSPNIVGQVGNLRRIVNPLRKLANIVPAAEGRPINNRPQVANLPHKIVASAEK